MGYPVFYVPSGDVLPVMFTSYDGGTGASVTLTGLAVTDIEIYKDGGVTQRASDAGYTLLDTDGIDFDAITGIHGFSIDTGDNTDAGFYTVGAWFTVVVSAVTIDAQTVSFIACQFRLMPAESVAGKPKVDVDAWLGTAAATPTTAGVPEVDVTHWLGTACATPTVAGVPEVDLTHIGGDAQSGTDLKDFADAGYDPATNKIQGLVLADAVTTVNGLAANVITAAATAADFTTEVTSGLSTLTAAQVNAEVVDALNVDTYAEPGQEAPAATASLVYKIGMLYKGWRNKKDNNGTTTNLYADDATTVDQKQATSESGGTVTKGEWAAGP